MAVIKFAKIFTRPLVIYEATGALGDQLIISNAEDVPSDGMRARTMFVEGEATFTRVRGTNGAGHITRRVPGDCTLDPQKYKKVKAGKIRVEVVTPTFKYYCLNHPEHKKLQGKVLRQVAGDSFVSPVGHWVFIGKGSVTTEVNGVQREFNAPHLFDITTRDVTFVATTDALLAQIDKV